jgi:alpha-glucosidase
MEIPKLSRGIVRRIKVLSGYICTFDSMLSTARIILLLMLWSLAPMLAASPDTSVVRSPDNKLTAFIKMINGKAELVLVSGQDKLCVLSLAGIKTGEEKQDKYWQIIRQSQIPENRLASAMYGPSSVVNEAFNELRLTLKSNGGNDTLLLAVRIYDIGLAFRYLIPSVKSGTKVYGESTTMQFEHNNRCTWAWADYQTLEKTYFQTPIDEAKHVALPFTIQKSNGTCISIAEAAVVNYTTATLLQDSLRSDLFHWNLVPAADGSAVHVPVQTDTLKTPWRVILIGEDAAKLANNQLVWLLNDPPAADRDWSWVHPINYCGIWWEMHLGLSAWQYAGGRHGATTANAMKHIDFAASHGIGGVLIEGWNAGWEKWGEKNAFDFITTYPDFDLTEVAQYARSKGVELIGHHETGGDWIRYEEMMDSAFALYASLGIHYVKTGYAGPMQPEGESHHGQLKVAHLQKVVETAAKYHIMIDAHEPVIPSGLSRTWPNLMTFEAVRGMEWNAWSEGNSPTHHCILPFTRALAGPIDYTPGIVNLLLNFRQSERVKWNGLDKGTSQVHGTLAHQLALSVIFYSPMQMMADLPENYALSNITDVLSRIPASWDTSIVLSGDPGKYIVTARRKGNIWYVAGITSDEPRTINLKTDFLLSAKTADAVIYEDVDASDRAVNEVSLASRTLMLNAEQPLNLNLKPGGGFLLVIELEN